MLNLQVKKNNQHDVEVITCNKCQGTWFSSVQANRYVVTAQSINMSTLSVHNNADFYLLLCLKCGNLVVPPVDGWSTATQQFNLYQEMIQEINSSQTEKPTTSEIIKTDDIINDSIIKVNKKG